jgi:hypothetical protein
MQLVTGMDLFSFYLSWAFVSHGQKDSPPSSSFMRATRRPRSQEPTLRLCVVSAQGCSHVPVLQRVIGFGPKSLCTQAHICKWISHPWNK